MGTTPTGTDGLASTPEERGEARVRREEERIRALESNEPLRRPILKALVEKIPWVGGDLIRGLTSEELAQQLEADLKDVERELELLGEGGLLVKWERDEGGRVAGEWLLTDYGISEMNHHRAFGAREPLPPPPTAAQTTAFMESALRNTVQMKDDPKYCEEVPERLQLILEQAEKMKNSELAESARLELSRCMSSPAYVSA